MKPLKVLLVSHSPVLPSGMAETLRLLFGELQNGFPKAYDIHQLALYHVHAVVAAPWPLMPTFSTVDSKSGKRYLDIADADGQLSFALAIERFTPDVVFAFNDPQKASL